MAQASKLKIGFYLENQNIPDVDLSQPAKGNPGCGGTEFLFVALPYYLEKLGGPGYQPVILANHVQNLPDCLTCYSVEDVWDAARAAKAHGCSIFVYRPRRHQETGLIELLSSLDLSAICWLHVTPTGQHLRELAYSSIIKAFVCVEHEQHDLAWDSPAWSKLTYIVNGFDIENFQLPTPPPKEPDLVVYLGSLVPQKGFHLLAKVWPRVLQRCPNARLEVIGTGALYKANARLGRWNIAERGYEEQYIIPYLAGEDGQPHPSVTFLGKLGLEKKDVLHRAVVGVPNPTGQSENCPGSALEFQACGTAVVSGAYFGLLDTVLDGQTGLLGRTETDLVNNICLLLRDTKKSRELGSNGANFIESRYNYESVTQEWYGLFDRVNCGEKPNRIWLKQNLHRHSKFLIFINRFFQMTLGRIVPWPSVVDIKIWMYQLLRRRKLKRPR